MGKITKLAIRIYNLYSKVFKTTRYVSHFNNVPVERLTYYPEAEEMFMAVAFREDLGPGICVLRVPENLHKVVIAHASTGRRVAFFTDKDHNMGHIFFGEESHLEIKRQIDEGFRPAGWGNPNSPDWDKWKKKMIEWKHVDQDEESWGFAKVLHGVTPELGFKSENEANK